MKYRTKIYLALLAISFATASFGLAIIYHNGKRAFLYELKDRVISVAATTASLLDPNLIQNVIQKGSENTPDYRELIKELQEARDANRTADLYVKFLYMLYLSPNHPDQLLYLADAEQNSAETRYLGESYLKNQNEEIKEHLNGYYSPSHFIKNQWGIWMSGFAPVYDNQGNYLATVGVDVSLQTVDKKLNKLLLYGVWSLAGAFVFSLIGAHILSNRVSRSLHLLCDGIEEIGRGNLEYNMQISTNDEFNDLASSINKMTKGLRERETLKTSFARYVSHHVLEKILKSDTPLKLEGERRKITILFTDLRNFTLLAEKKPPELVVAILNEYFEAMIDVIFSYQGTLDKFIGDGMLVEFGSPLEDQDHELHAVQAAIEMQKKLRELCTKWQRQGKPEVQMGIGIHTGAAIIGNIGSEKRMEFTAVGDSVNVAARLEQTTKQLNIPILVSDATFAKLKGIFPHKDLGLIALPGRTEEIHAYVIDPFNMENSTKTLDT